MPKGHRLTTFVITMPRYILAEFNTHRALARNSASSRAIPFKRMVESVTNNPFIPMKWMKDHSGMQGTQYFTPEEVHDLDLEGDWLAAREFNIERAQSLNRKGVTKQMCNRLLEPYAWHTVITTASEWENFYALRFQEGADIHIQEIARLMLEAANASIPKKLSTDDWHIPFGDDITDEAIVEALNGTAYFDRYYQNPTGMKVAIATARCAQVSYTVVGEDGKPMDFLKLIALHDRLAKMGHWSPFEHSARVMSEHEYSGSMRVVPIAALGEDVIQYGWCGNYRGFIQYRKMFAGENRKDDRLLKKI